MATDFIPDPDADFDEWQQNLLTHVNAGGAAWAIPDPKVAALNTRQTQWATDYAAGGKHVDRTDSQQLKKTQTRDVYEKEIRDFIGEFIRKNSLIDDDDRKAMKLTVPDTEPTARQQIDTAPSVRLIPKAGARFVVECRVKSDSTRVSRHKDADGVELAYIVAPKNELPANPNVTTESKLSGSARVRLELSIEDAGKSLHVFARWINTTDDSKNGPWSGLASKVISD